MNWDIQFHRDALGAVVDSPNVKERIVKAIKSDLSENPFIATELTDFLGGKRRYEFQVKDGRERSTYAAYFVIDKKARRLMVMQVAFCGSF